jgi:hypothetical protein
MILKSVFTSSRTCSAPPTPKRLDQQDQDLAKHLSFVGFQECTVFHYLDYIRYKLCWNRFSANTELTKKKNANAFLDGTKLNSTLWPTLNSPSHLISTLVECCALTDDQICFQYNLN